MWSYMRLPTRDYIRKCHLSCFIDMTFMLRMLMDANGPYVSHKNQGGQLLPSTVNNTVMARFASKEIVLASFFFNPTMEGHFLLFSTKKRRKFKKRLEIVPSDLKAYSISDLKMQRIRKGHPRIINPTFSAGLKKGLF